MNSKKFIFISALILIVVLSIIVIVNESKPLDNIRNSLYTQSVISEKPSGGNFTLTAADGKHSLNEYQGKLVLLYFGYTYCPDICPTDLGNLSMTYHNLSQAEKDQIQIIFVTVDPERDTAARMLEYTNYFDANMVGLTGSKKEIAQVAKQYGAVYAKAEQHNQAKQNANYSVDHSAFTYLIDQQGQLQTQLAHASSPKQISQLIQMYLSKKQISNQ
ncbi:MAG: protein SCO1 [Thiomicrorhabdus sp.]|nr:MAG: protein SCO1 [Thiomicrorhabdus sp.]